MSVRTLRLTLAYEGTRYAGWQVQRDRTRQTAHSRQNPTIQGTLERVLTQILREAVTVIGSGRTDAGVHALAQVAHLRTRSSIACERLRRALNSLLPPDIAVTDVHEAPAGFHARFDVLAKRYRYQLITGPVVLPFERRYVHHVRAPLDVPLMQREAGTLIGRHQMRVFQKTGSSVRDTRRRISGIWIRRQRSRLTIEIEADGFLYGMVRRIVGTLLDIGRGYRPPGTMARIVNTQDSRLVGPSAPAKGLCLVRVRYPLVRTRAHSCAG